MARPFDLSKMKKFITKSVEGMSYGFRDPVTWIDTGCYMLNYLISNDFHKGIPLEGKFTMFAGDSGCLPASAKVVARVKHRADNRIDDALPRELTVGALRSLYKLDDLIIQIETPNGFRTITEWFDKGFMPVITVQAIIDHVVFSTTCSVNHLLQVEDGSFRMAFDLEVGDTVVTKNGLAKVSNIIEPDWAVDGEEECFDFTVNDLSHAYYGDDFVCHNSGKSYMATANIIKWCQKNNVWAVMIDTENALDQSWMEPLGVDTSEDAMDKVSVAAIDDLAKFLGKLIEDYRASEGSKPYEERQKMVIIIDSLGMLITANQDKQFMEGDQKGDMGIKAKQLTATLRVLLSKIADQPIGVVATNHVFDAQDQYKPDSIPGGKMLEFASSVIIQMNKLLLKEDEDGKEIKEVTGIKSSCVVRKSRYAKPFEKLKISIPYSTGMNPYSGLFDLFKKKGLFVQAGSWFTYTSPETGEVFKSQGAFKKDILNQIMSEWSHWDNDNSVGFDETISIEEEIEE